MDVCGKAQHRCCSYSGEIDTKFQVQGVELVSRLPSLQKMFDSQQLLD